MRRPSRPVPSRAASMPMRAASDPCGDRPEPSVPTRAASVPTRAAQQQLRIESSKRHLQTITYVYDMCIICISIDYHYRPYPFVLSLITVACTARHGRKNATREKRSHRSLLTRRPDKQLRHFKTHSTSCHQMMTTMMTYGKTRHSSHCRQLLKASYKS